MSAYICMIWLFLSIITVPCQGQATERPVVPGESGATVRNVDIKHEVPTQGLCRDGWSRGTMTEISGREIPICIQINPNQQTWTDAQSTCRKNYGFLLKLDSLVNVNNADIYSMLRSEDISEFWTGLHSEHGHLVWDDLLPNQLRPHNRMNATSTVIRPWSWDNELFGNQQQYCGQMNVEADDDSRRRKRRSPDDDSNDNIFPGLNMANFRHRVNNAFGRRTNRFPPSSPFASLFSRQQMSDQLAELPGAMDLLNGNSQADFNNPDSNNPDSNNPDSNNPDSNNPDSSNPDSNNPDSNSPDSNSPDFNNPDSDSQISSLTTDTPTFGPMTTFDTDTDTVTFGTVEAGTGSEATEQANPLELVTSVKKIAATLMPGMELGQTDSTATSLDTFNNENPSSFDSQPSETSGNDGRSDGSQVTTDSPASSFGSALFDSTISDDKPVTVESDNSGAGIEATTSSLLTTVPDVASVTVVDDKDKIELKLPSVDESAANIGDLFASNDDTKSTIGAGILNIGDGLSTSDDGSSDTISDLFGSMVSNDALPSVDDSLISSDDSKLPGAMDSPDTLTLSDDSKTTPDVLGNDILDTITESLSDSSPDVKDIIEKVVGDAVASNDEIVDVASSIVPDETLSDIHDVVDDSLIIPDNIFSPGSDDIIPDDITLDKNSESEINPVLYPELNIMADAAEGIADIVDDIKDNINEQSVDDGLHSPSDDDGTLDDDINNQNSQIIPRLPSIGDATEIELADPSINKPDLLDILEDRLGDLTPGDIPDISDDATDTHNIDSGLGDTFNQMDITDDGLPDDGLTDQENINISDNTAHTDDTELAGDLLDTLNDQRNFHDDHDLSDRIETIQDHFESNSDRQLEHVNDLADALSSLDDKESQDLARPFDGLEDFHDVRESNIDTGDVVESLTDTDGGSLQEIAREFLPDETDTQIDDLHDGDDRQSIGTVFHPNSDAIDDFAEMRELEQPKPDLSYLDRFIENDQQNLEDDVENDNKDFGSDLNDDVNENEHRQAVINPTATFGEREHDEKDGLTDDFETTTKSGDDFETETKRELDWTDVDDMGEENRSEVESDTEGIQYDDTDHHDDPEPRDITEQHDDPDHNEREPEHRQTVVDGNFGLTRDDDRTDAQENDNGRDQDDNQEDNIKSFNKETGSYPADQDEDDDAFDDLPSMSENVVEESMKHSLSPTMLNAEMKLSTCDVKLPSVCFSYEVLVSNEASTCEDGWYGHVLLDTCYKVLDRKMSYPAAVSRCSSLNARVIIASSEFERRYSLMAVQQDGKHHRGGRFWMESPSEKRNCKLFSERGVETVPSCRAAMNVICVKDSKSLSVYSTNQFPDDIDADRFYDDNGDDVMFSSRGVNNSLPCRLASGASEFPVLWFKDGVMMASKDKLVSSDLSLHVDKELLSAFSLVTDRPLSLPTLQGQYWCEVWDRQTLTRMRSRAFNVRFSDIISFHGSMEVGEFDHENEVLFNMMNRKFPKLSAVEADIQTVFNDELSALQAYVPQVQDVSTFTDGIRYDRPVIEYHVFFTMSRGYTISDEQLLYSRIKAGLRSKLGNRNYIMELPGHTPINSFRTMSLQSTVSCPGASLQTTLDIYGQTIPVKEFAFPTTLLGEFANSLQNCSITNQLPAGSARCVGDFYTGALWSEVVANECIEEIAYNPQYEQTWAPSPYTAELTNLAKATADAANAEKLVSEVAQIAKVAPKFTPTDINKIADVLEHTTQVKDLPKKVGENVLKTIDRLMTDSYNEAHVANVETKAANRIIKALERFAENADLGTQKQMRFVTDNVAVEIWDLKEAGQPVIGLAVETTADGISKPFKTDSIATVYNKSQFYDANVDAAIELPEEVFSKKEKGAMISDRLTMIVYRKSKLFQAAITDGGNRISPTDQQMSHLNSYIISASITGKKIQHLNEKVKCIFKPKKESDGQNKCVWWDFTMNENKGGWSNRGCVYDGMVNGRDVCLCDHLTNFAVLIDFYGQGKPIPEHHELSLSIITVLGLSCSILGLSLTIISFLFFRKLRQGRAQQTLFNLSLSLLLSMLVFLVGIKQTHNDYVCIVVAILLHYLILVSFMWMLMEAILQYLTFVKILGTYITRFMLKTVLPAWGLPLLPVISVLSIDYTLYKGGPDYCWMDLSVFYYAFAVPVTLIILINITIFIVTIISIFRRGKGLRSNQKKQKMAMTNLQAALTSFILLGLTWIFGYLAISDARLLFQYVFTILNSLQGFFIFILFVVRKKKVRDQWYIICCKGTDKDRVSRSLSASNSIPSTYSNGSRNSRKDGHERDRSDSTKTIQSTYSNTSNGFTNYGYDHSYEFPFSRHDRRAFRNF